VGFEKVNGTLEFRSPGSGFDLSKSLIDLHKASRQNQGIESVILPSHKTVLSQSKQSTSANLQIVVNVVPIVQSPNAAPPEKQNSAITYTLEESPREQRQELRILPPSPLNSGGAKNAAILDTLVVVPQ